MKTILIANRGEIAVRVMRACREMGIGTVAIYSDVDREARHVRYADRAFPLVGNAPADTYLRIDKILEIARHAGADAVHPGYGFLAENEDFAQACVDAGVTFIGPSPAVIARMGSKTAARACAMAAGAPVVPGTETPVGPDVCDAEVQRLADAVGYPLMVKAVAGGGGKGMREVRSGDALLDAVRRARSEALGAFGDAAVYFERRVVRPRHVEIQLLADQHGTVLPFVERECSVQRRHQKVIEESPAPRMSLALRQRMAEAAASVARAAGYTNAGTIEFLVDADDAFYFLEMNTRLQVEHPVTEMVTGVDLVQWQIRIARGERLTVTPDEALTPRGHAIECRVYAEDPDQRFMPRPGRITSLTVPGGPGIRDDSGVEVGFEVPIYYDSMISKLVAWGARPRAGAPPHVARTGRVSRRRHPDDVAVLQVDARAAGVRERRARHHHARCRTRASRRASRSSRPRPRTARRRSSPRPPRRSSPRAGQPTPPASPPGHRYARAGRRPRGVPRSESRIPACPCGFTSSRTGRSGRSRSPRVRRPRRVDVHLDGAVLTCDVRDLGHGRLSLRLPDGSMHDVVVETEATPGHRTVHVQGIRVPTVVSTRVRRGASGRGAADGPLRIIAPMPGKVVRVPVSVPATRWRRASRWSSSKP